MNPIHDKKVKPETHLKKISKKTLLKTRLDAFSDAIIAIIITIMVLSLPIKKVGGQIDYLDMFRAIGIYAVSFCFVGNLWYQHAEIFNSVKKVTNFTVVFDLAWLFIMSLLPTFTKLMIDDTSKTTVQMYGVLCLVLIIMLHLMANRIAKNKYRNNPEYYTLYSMVHSHTFNIEAIQYIVIILLSFFIPHVALVLFLIMSIYSFVSNARENNDFKRAAKMVSKNSFHMRGLNDNEKSDLKKQAKQIIKEVKLNK